MKFDSPLLQGIFLKRYKRFFVDIKFNDQIITAHCPNTGSMKSVNIPNSLCRFSQVDDPKRKLKYTLEMCNSAGQWVGVNTAKTNHLAYEILRSFCFKHWENFDSIAKEVKINDQSRIDFVLWNSNKFNEKKPSLADLSNHKFHFVEVKNVSLAEEGVAMFPDSVTERGQKHIIELIHLMEKGHSAEMLYVIPREDCSQFRPAFEIDPEYAILLKEAFDRGLIITPVPAKLSDTEIKLEKKILPLEKL